MSTEVLFQRVECLCYLHEGVYMRIPRIGQAEYLTLRAHLPPWIVDEGEAKPMKDIGVEFERAFVRLAVEMAEKKGMGKQEFAHASFRGKVPKDDYRRLYAMLNPTKTGKPQKLTLMDAVRMADAIGQSFPGFCFEVMKEAERTTKEDILDDDSPLEEESPPPRVRLAYSSKKPFPNSPASPSSHRPTLKILSSRSER